RLVDYKVWPRIGGVAAFYSAANRIGDQHHCERHDIGLPTAKSRAAKQCDTSDRSEIWRVRRQTHERSQYCQRERNRLESGLFLIHSEVQYSREARVRSPRRRRVAGREAIFYRNVVRLVGSSFSVE